MSSVHLRDLQCDMRKNTNKNYTQYPKNFFQNSENCKFKASLFLHFFIFCGLFWSEMECDLPKFARKCTNFLNILWQKIEELNFLLGFLFVFFKQNFCKTKIFVNILLKGGKKMPPKKNFTPISSLKKVSPNFSFQHYDKHAVCPRMKLGNQFLGHGLPYGSA